MIFQYKLELGFPYSFFFFFFFFFLFFFCFCYLMEKFLQRKFLASRLFLQKYFRFIEIKVTVPMHVFNISVFYLSLITKPWTHPST